MLDAKSVSFINTATASASAAAAPVGPRSVYTVRLVHHQEMASSAAADGGSDQSSTPDLIVNPKSFPGVRLGDMLAITSADEKVEPNRYRRLHVRVTSLEPIKGNLELSLLKSIADQFELSARKEVNVRIVSEDLVALDTIELVIKNQYIGRADMWRIKTYMCDECVYYSKPYVVSGMRMRIDSLSLNGVITKSGLVTPNTKFNFRSRSARLFFLIQLSDEMYEFADDGETYFEKVIGFLKVLFIEWDKQSVGHAISIIFFSRTFLELDPTSAAATTAAAAAAAAAATAATAASTSASAGNSSFTRHWDSVTQQCTIPGDRVIQMDNMGRYYQDQYQVIVDNDEKAYTGAAPNAAPAPTTTSTTTASGTAASASSTAANAGGGWDRLLVQLKTRFHAYQRIARWGLTDPVTGIRGRPAAAMDGNVLEAINCAVSVYDKHYMDRDLNRTGQNIILISAGSGLFSVDSKLAKLTKQRMADNGIGCDIICMTRPPLHIVPLFSYQPEHTTQTFEMLLSAAVSQPAASASASQRSVTIDASNVANSAITAGAWANANANANSRDVKAESGKLRSPQPPAASSAASSPVTTTSFVPHATPSAARSSHASGVLGLKPKGGHHLTSSHSSINLLSGGGAAGTTPNAPDPVFGDDSVGSTNSRLSPAEIVAAAAAAMPVYHTPRWLHLTFYDHQELLDRPFGTQQMLQKARTLRPGPEIVRDRSRDFLSTSAVRMFGADKFDLRWANALSSAAPAITVPPFTARISTIATASASASASSAISYKPVSVPSDMSLDFDSYDSAVFAPNPNAAPPLNAPPAAAGSQLSHSSSSNSLTGLEKHHSHAHTHTHTHSSVLTKHATYHSSAHTFSPPTAASASAQTALGTSPSNASPHLQPSSNPLMSPSLHSHSKHRGGAGHPPLPTLSLHHPSGASASTAVVPAAEKKHASAGSSGIDADRVRVQRPARWISTNSTPLVPELSSYTPFVPQDSINRNIVINTAESEKKSVGTVRVQRIVRVTNADGSVAGNACVSLVIESVQIKTRGDANAGGAHGSGAGGMPRRRKKSLSRVSSINPFSTNVPTPAEARRVVTGPRSDKPSNRWRWSHLFATDDVLLPLRPNWKSLCKPAILPLTTDYMPPSIELKNDYFEYNYNVQLVRNENHYNNVTESLLREIICQRLAQDYQNILTEDSSTLPPISSITTPASLSLSSPSNSISLTPTQSAAVLATSPTDAATGASGSLMHSKLQYYFSIQNQLHRITYDRRTGSLDVKRYLLKSAIQTLEKIPYRYQLWSEHTQSFLSVDRDIEPNRDEFDWNYADHLLCGMHEEFQDNLKIRRMRFAIIPASGSGSGGTTATPSGDSKRDSNSPDAERDRKAESLNKFLHSLFKQKMAQLKITAFKPAAAPNASASSSEVAETNSERKRNDTNDLAQGFARRNVPYRTLKVPIKTPTLKNLGNRFEWFRLQYDTVFDAFACYHMELLWVAATGVLIEDWVQNFKRKGKQYGFHIVQIPTTQPLRTSDSFHATIPIALPSIAPPPPVAVATASATATDSKSVATQPSQPPAITVSPAARVAAQNYLLQNCGFVLDSHQPGFRRQYMHYTGACLVRTVSDGFVWVNNYLISANPLRDVSISAFRKFTAFCDRLGHVQSILTSIIQKSSLADLPASGTVGLSKALGDAVSAGAASGDDTTRSRR